MTAPTSPGPPTALQLDPRRKLLPLQVFSLVHAVDFEVALALVEDHRLWPAFNLASAASGKRKIHLWRGTVENFRQGQPCPKPKLEPIIDSILPILGLTPAATATIRAVDLGRCFCLTTDSIAKMIRLGELTEVGGHDPAMESPHISRPSIVAFLSRRIL